jgi:opacity protein-like surface antigen
MKRFAWIIILLLSLQAYGQQNFASISFGASFPLGDYGLTGDLASNGYAKTGGAIKFDAGFFPGSYLGIGGSFSFGSNYALRDSLLQDMIDYLLENTTIIDIPDDADIQYGSGFWNNLNLFVGPHFSIRALQRLYFDFRVLGGLSILRPPDQELAISFDQTEIFALVSNSKVSYGFAAGAGLRFTLNENLALRLGADFTQSKSKFDYTFDLFRDVTTSVVPPVHSEFWIQTIEIMLGLAYAF